MPRITELSAHIANAGGVARPNRYKVTINPLNAFGGVVANANATIGVPGAQSILERFFKLIAGDTWQRLSFFCDKAELPGKAFVTSDIRHYGPTYKQPNQSVFSDINLQFLVGHDMNEKYFFDAWQYAIEDPLSQDYSYHKNYVTDILIEQLSDIGTPIIRPGGPLDKVQGVINEVTDAVNGLPFVGGLHIPEISYGRTYAVQLYDCWPIGVSQMQLDYSETDTPHRLTVSFSYRRWVNDHFTVESNFSDSNPLVDRLKQIVP